MSKRLVTVRKRKPKMVLVPRKTLERLLDYNEPEEANHYSVCVSEECGDKYEGEGGEDRAIADGVCPDHAYFLCAKLREAIANQPKRRSKSRR